MRRRIFLLGAAALSAGALVYLILGNKVVGSGDDVVGRRCSYCGMEIRDRRFAAVLVVNGEKLFYDDVGCMMIHYLSVEGVIPPVSNAPVLGKVEKIHVYDFGSSEKVDGFSAWYVLGSRVETPMRRGVIAFKSFSDAVQFARSEGGEVVGWDGALQTFLGGDMHTDMEHEGHDYSHAFHIPLTTVDGKTVTVSEILRQGKPVLLVFFATWCPTCSKNTSTLSTAYRKFRGKALVLLSSFDPRDTSEKIQQFLKIHGASEEWIVTQPNLDFLVALRVITQETIFAIAPNGEIVYEKRFGTLTEDDWVNVVEKLSA